MPVHLNFGDIIAALVTQNAGVEEARSAKYSHVQAPTGADLASAEIGLDLASLAADLQAFYATAAGNGNSVQLVERDNADVVISTYGVGPEDKAKADAYIEKMSAE